MNQPKGLTVNSPDGLFARARTGDQAAWNELYAACSPKVLRVVRRRMASASIRSLYDSTDFVGDVWKSLAEKPEQFDFPTLESLQAFLIRAAERKVIDVHRRRHAQKNDVGRERPLGAWEVAGGGRPELASDDPTPSQVAQARETREQLFADVPEEDRAVLELKDQGYSNDEVAQRTGWHVRRVQRFLKELSDSWTARSWGGRP